MPTESQETPPAQARPASIRRHHAAIVIAVAALIGVAGGVAFQVGRAATADGAGTPTAGIEVTTAPVTPPSPPTLPPPPPTSASAPPSSAAAMPGDAAAAIDLNTAAAAVRFVGPAPAADAPKVAATWSPPDQGRLRLEVWSRIAGRIERHRLEASFAMVEATRGRVRLDHLSLDGESLGVASAQSIQVGAVQGWMDDPFGDQQTARHVASVACRVLLTSGPTAAEVAWHPVADRRWRREREGVSVLVATDGPAPVWQEFTAVDDATWTALRLDFETP